MSHERAVQMNLLRIYEEIRVNSFPERHFQPEAFHAAIGEFVGGKGAGTKKREVGRSSEERPLFLYSAGAGSIPVLLWSQMHGDESTATMAIADILHYLSSHAGTTPVRNILSKLTLHFLPILNPDGAARCTRRTSQGIDINRDALALVTPEARLLKTLQKKLKPEFGFNLHDQELSTVGTSKRLTAIGLLAPAYDDKKSDNRVRKRAKLLASVFAAAVTPLARGSIARYDDTFEPRAFGDNMQKWGTSTLLVESGHALDDGEKMFIRKLNFVGIVAALTSVATKKFLRAPLRAYASLPVNGKKAYDVIIRNVRIDQEGKESMRADLGISYQVDTHSEEPPRLVDVGDLSTFIALRDIDGKGKGISSAELRQGARFDWEEKGFASSRTP